MGVDVYGRFLRMTNAYSYIYTVVWFDKQCRLMALFMRDIHGQDVHTMYICISFGPQAICIIRRRHSLYGIYHQYRIRLHHFDRIHTQGPYIYTEFGVLINAYNVPHTMCILCATVYMYKYPSRDGLIITLERALLILSASLKRTVFGLPYACWQRIVYLYVARGYRKHCLAARTQHPPCCFGCA